MKRFFLAVAAFFLLLPFGAGAQSSDESIRTFNVSARLEADRGFTVTEEIAYDLGATPHHGIIREIPEWYDRNGGRYSLQFSVKEVTLDGRSVKYDVSHSSGRMRVKIGDADEFIEGVHVYRITYFTDRAVNFFDGAGELYWNVTGNEWEVPISQAAFMLTGPDGFDASSASKKCFTGVFGSTEEQCDVRGTANQAQFTARSAFPPGEGMTVVIGFPKGVVQEPTVLETIGRVVRDNGILALPLIVLGIMLWLWHTKGRDPEGRGTVVPHYAAPRTLSPAELVALETQDVPMRAVTATILDLARRGYLKIDFGEEKGMFKKTTAYMFIKQKDADSGLSDADKEVFNGLFETGDRTTLTELKGSFYKRVSPFKNAVFASLKHRGLFEASPISVRALYTGTAIGLGAIGIWVAGPIFGGIGIAAFVLSALIIAVIGWYMPRSTAEGAAALEEVKGFKWFLSVTEKDRLAFHNAPQLKPLMFHAFLPAAIAFGVEEKWAEQFNGLDIPPPDYATGSVLHHWMAMNFVHDLNRMNSAAAASAYVAPSSAGSGGSGFSGGGGGGGFGGGGGGSW